jgi:alpha-amylase
MEVKRPRTRFRDLLNQDHEPITTNEDGWAEWRCGGGSVSVWVEEAALLEQDLPELGEDDVNHSTESIA